MCVCSGDVSVCEGLEIAISSKKEGTVSNRTRHILRQDSYRVGMQEKLSSTNSSPLGLAHSSTPSFPLLHTLF